MSEKEGRRNPVNAKNPCGMKLYLSQMLPDEDRKPDQMWVWSLEASGVRFSVTVNSESISAG